MRFLSVKSCFCRLKSINLLRKVKIIDEFKHSNEVKCQ